MPKSKKYKVNPIYKNNKFIWVVYAIIIVSILNVLLSKKSYVDQNLQLTECRGLQFGSTCLGKKEVIGPNIELPELQFNN